MTRRQIAKPEWFTCAVDAIEHTLRLYHADCLPKSIEAFMVVTPLKHALRGIYGKGNVGVAWIMLGEAIREYYRNRYYDLRFRLGMDRDLDAETKPQEEK